MKLSLHDMPLPEPIDPVRLRRIKHAKFRVSGYCEERQQPDELHEIAFKTYARTEQPYRSETHITFEGTRQEQADTYYLLEHLNELLSLARQAIGPQGVKCWDCGGNGREYGIEGCAFTCDRCKGKGILSI